MIITIETRLRLTEKQVSELDVCAASWSSAYRQTWVKIMMLVASVVEFCLNPFKSVKELKEYVKVEKDLDNERHVRELKDKFQLNANKAKKRCL